MVTTEVRYNYRLRVSDQDRRLLKGVYDACRTVWNRALGDWAERWTTEGHHVSYAEASKGLTARRKALDWLRAQPQNPQEQVLRDLYHSIGTFFDKTNPAGRPAFKAKRRGYATARWTKNGFKVSGSGFGHVGDRLEVATAGGRRALRVVWSRPLPSAPSSVTVYQDRGGRWFASFVVRVEIPGQPVLPTGKATGLDIGLTTFATTEDPSSDVVNPRFARRAATAGPGPEPACRCPQEEGLGQPRSGKAQAGPHRSPGGPPAPGLPPQGGPLPRLGLRRDRRRGPRGEADGGTGRSAQNRPQPLDRRCRLGPVPPGPPMAGHQGRKGNRGAARSWQHPTLFIVRLESQAPHRALGPSVSLS